jgi:hypothetical protein
MAIHPFAQNSTQSTKDIVTMECSLWWPCYSCVNSRQLLDLSEPQYPFAEWH